MNTLNQLKTRDPINRQAAMMLAKAPWWAYPPPELQAEIIKQAEMIPVTELIDATKPPPQNVTDRRGLVLFWNNGRQGVVTGYCHKITQGISRSENALIRRASTHGRYKGSCYNIDKAPIETRSLHVWWIFSNGDFFPTKWKAPSSRAWRTQEEMDRGSNPPKMKWDIV